LAELPKIVRQRLAGRPADGEHLDANLLAAFSEGALTKREREGVVAHLATCAHCRDVVALSTPEAEVTTGGISIAAAAEQRRFVRSFARRWGVVAITACLVVGSAVMLRLRPSYRGAERRQVAQAEPQVALPPASKAAEPAAKTQDRDALAVTRQQPAVESERHAGRLRAPMEAAPAVAPPTSQPKVKAEAPVAEMKVGSCGAVVKKQAAAQAKDRLESFAKLNRPPASSVPVAAPPPPPPAPTTAYMGGPVAKSPQNLGMGANAAAAPEAKGESGGAGGIVAGNRAGISGTSATSAPAAVPPQAVARAKTSMRTVNAALIVRWTIAADGTLQRSFDNGQSWQAVTLEIGKPFRAVTNAGAVVWAGGSNGALFRSTDAGEHWTRVQPMSGKQGLMGDITAIALAGPANQIVRVQTSSGQKWVSTDGGSRWNLEQ
jgi:hypothetical protein